MTHTNTGQTQLQRAPVTLETHPGRSSFLPPTLTGIPLSFSFSTPPGLAPQKGRPLKPAGALQHPCPSPGPGLLHASSHLQSKTDDCRRVGLARRKVNLPGTELVWGAACTYVLRFDESLHILVCFRSGKGNRGIILLFKSTLILLLTSVLMFLFVSVLSGKCRRPLKHLGRTAYRGVLRGW